MSTAVIRRLPLGAALLAAAATADAGRSCEQKAPSARAVAQAMQLAERTAARLSQSGASVVVIARAGQNLSEYGLRYSHLGFAYREGDGSSAVWRVVHKLNQCGTARATLYRQGLGEFFLDDLWQYEAAIVVLAPEAQAHLRAALVDNGVVARLDTPAYSMVAYPWSERYQQSNQWAIETLAMAEEPARRRASGRRHGCVSAATSRRRCTSSALQRLGARIASANVAFDDHPDEKRFADRIETVTVDSVFRWLERDGLGGRSRSYVRLPLAPPRAALREPRLTTHADVAAPVAEPAGTRTRTSSRCSASAASRRSSGPSSSAPATTTCSSSRSR